MILNDSTVCHQNKSLTFFVCLSKIKTMLNIHTVRLLFLYLFKVRLFWLMKVPGLNPNDVYVTTFVFYILKTINKSTFLCRFNVIVNIITMVAPIFFQIELQGYFPLAYYYSFRTFFKTLMLIQLIFRQMLFALLYRRSRWRKICYSWCLYPSYRHGCR